MSEETTVRLTMEISPEKGESPHFSVNVETTPDRAWEVANELVQQLSRPTNLLIFTPPSEGGPRWERRWYELHKGKP